jgi:GTP cyclohydrolase IV
VFSDLTYDACSQTPSYRLPLDRVSIFNQRIYLRCEDSELGPVNGLFNVRAGATLKAAQRGIHMSRIEAAFRDVPRGLTLLQAGIHIARAIRALQHESTAEVSLAGNVPFNRRTRVTSQLSPGTLRLLCRARAGEAERAGVGLKIPIMTCCPCMQPYSLEELARFAEIAVDDPASVIRTIPVATHSQKGSVVVIVHGPPPLIENLTFASLYEATASATHPTFELLKRPDEYDLIRRAHLRPQFVEDVVRDVSVAVAERCSALQEVDGDQVRITVSAASLESIHGHDISARKTTPLSTLRALLD